MSTRITPVWLEPLSRSGTNVVPKHPTMPRDASSSTRALLEKRRHMDRQANHVEYAVLNRLCRRRLAEDHANLVRSRLLDAAHRKRSLKMEKRALAENRLSIPCSKAPDGSRCSSGPEMENIMANFYTALYKSDSGQTAVLSPEEEVSPILTSEVRQGSDIVLITRSPDDASEMLRRLDEERSKAGLTINKTKTKNVMRKLEWDNMVVRVDGRLLHYLHFADDIVLITPNISQAERMLAHFDDSCGKIGLRLNLTKKMFMRNGWVPDAPFSLNGTTISKCSCYVYLGRKVNMMNDLAPKLGRGKQATWKAYKSIEKVVKKTKITTLRAHPFNTTVLPALTYVSETSRTDYRTHHISALSLPPPQMQHHVEMS
ncbi:hypothetical protein ANCCEY_08126 [Ancylostoma ceylanicum]|uniref:Reverse transcriptase domain-containing protein n=1 Tax=Ancylostoma ceylanicum TaxID=53326 RepID=A0A0D6LL75_9BILA|nr:hypothetical protein ANCCEY_08126 [Ancylostoma ceylanicum]